MEEKIKHLEFVQNVITRMNTNSFQLKGWAITIVSALLALYASSTNVIYVFVAIVPTLIFGFIDAFYLQRERKFIGLYDDIVNGNVKPFSMSIEKYKYDRKDKKTKKYCYCKVFWSGTIAGLYCSLAVSLLLLGLFLCFKDCFTIHC